CTGSAPACTAAISATAWESSAPRPTAVRTPSRLNSTPTSASSDSSTRSTAARSAVASSVCSERTARNSTSCDVLHESEVMLATARVSAQSQGDDGLVVEAADALRAGNLSVRVEAGEWCAGGAALHDQALGDHPFVTEDGPTPGAVEHEQREQGYLAQV